jgi:secreted PhoX family phosphatase
VLRLGLRSGGTDYGQGTNTGAGKWIGPLAEFTGLQFLGDGKSFLIHLQHRTQDGRAVPGTTDELRVSGLKLP